MLLTKTEWIWMNGKFVKWDDAQIHVMSHVVSYGSSVFEGMRIYKTVNGPAAFRLADHTERLFNSAKVYRMTIKHTPDEIDNAILELASRNGVDEGYVRPIAFRGYGTLGVDPTNAPVDVAIACYPWGRYLGEEAIEKGVSVCFSSWNRMAPNTIPAMAKAGGNYLNSALIKMEAKSHGYAEGIALDVYGHVSEGSGENIFMVRKGTLITPTFTSSILPGITRNTVIRLADEMGIKVIEQNIPREAMYFADEVFFTGSAAEITPIAEIDHMKIGEGHRGPVTKQIQEAFFNLVLGKSPDKYGWLTLIPKPAKVAVR
jgi:branched-chain amino acid aminotransferase